MNVLTPAACSLLIMIACNNPSSTSETNKDSAMSKSDSGSNTNNTKVSDWVSLFDGKTTSGWHTYGRSRVGDAWKVDSGSIHLVPSKKEGFQTKEGGDIVTNDEFENFDLKLEWKISKCGNSGVIFLVKEDTSKFKYTWNTGPEMQVLDNECHPDGKIKKHRAGDLYDLISCKKETVKPAGEWNQVEIVLNKARLDLFLNGENVVSTTLWDDNWNKLVASSKFKDMPGFAKFHSGKIALQDHGNEVWFRNIMIKKL